MQILTHLFFTALTVGAYLIGRRLSLKYNHPLANLFLIPLFAV